MRVAACSFTTEIKRLHNTSRAIGSNLRPPGDREPPFANATRGAFWVKAGFRCIRGMGGAMSAVTPKFHYNSVHPEPFDFVRPEPFDGVHPEPVEGRNAAQGRPAKGPESGLRQACPERSRRAQPERIP